MEKLVLNNIGPTVRQFVLGRHALGLSQDAMAKKVGVGVATIRRLETQPSETLVSSVLRPNIYQSLISFFTEQKIEFVGENNEKLGVIYSVNG